MSADPLQSGADFHRSRMLRLDSNAPLMGLDEHWVAPLAVVDAKDGFGADSWISAMPESLLAIRLNGAAVRCEWGALRGRTTQACCNIALQVEGAPNHYSAAGAIRFAQIHLHRAFVEKVRNCLCEEPGHSGAELPDDMIFVTDDELERRALAYVDAALRPVTMVELEARAILVVERCLTWRASKTAPGLPQSGGLAPWQIRRACEMLDTLEETTSLAALASAVSLSPFHFARAFKTSTGLTPHRYQIARRMERARELLAGTDLPIIDVAAIVGYVDSGYFAKLFRRAAGLSPTAYRATCK